MKCFLLILIMSCALSYFPLTDATELDEQGHTKLEQPNIISFKNEFNAFWSQAEGQPFEDQVRLWTRLVEGTHQEFFDSIVWVNQKDDVDFTEKRIKQLEIAFSRFARHEDQIKKNLDLFEVVLTSQIARYRKTFPDAEFPLDCYAAIGGNFLGRVDTTKLHKVLAFGMDKIADMEVNADILYSHELFHVYQGKKSNVNNDPRMIAQLWAEGLASFVSHELNPIASFKDVFMYLSTAQIELKQLPKLASQFLKVANEKDDQSYFEWFLSERDGTIPAMAGYWLGYKVAEALHSQHDLSAMSLWSIEKAEKMAISVLKKFAQDEL